MSFGWHGSAKERMQSAAMETYGQRLRDDAARGAGGGGGNPYGRTNVRGGAATASSSGSSTPAAADPALAGQLSGANAQMQSYLGAAAPAYQGPGPNRFEAGLSDSEGRLRSLMNDPSSIQQTASYKFRLGQGEEALKRSQFAGGRGLSGGAAMELAKYGQDMGSQEYENQHKRLSDLTGMYAGNWNQAQGTNVQEALGQYGTAMQGHTARGNTLANLVGTATQGYTAGRGQDLNYQSDMARTAQAAQNSSGGGGGGVTVTRSGAILRPGGGTGTFNWRA